MCIDFSFKAPRRCVSICLALLLLTACGGKAFDYHSDTEIPNNPGVFSKDPEGFTIYDSEKGTPGQTSPKKAEGIQKEATAAEIKDTREFEDFEQWKQEKEQLQNLF